MALRPFTIAPEFFDLILPELGEKRLLTHQDIARISKDMRENGPGHASNVLVEILENAGDADIANDEISSQ